MNMRTKNPAIVTVGKKEKTILWAARIPAKETKARQNLLVRIGLRYIRSTTPRKDATTKRTVRGCPKKLNE
jgi:hypothetical protein